MRLTERPAEPVEARIVREVPAGSHEIPSPVLGTKWGGQVAVDPADESGTRTLDRVFHIELELDQPVSRLGGRTYVRFDHGTETLGRQSYRRLRQLFLRRFDAA